MATNGEEVPPAKDATPSEVTPEVEVEHSENFEKLKEKGLNEALASDMDQLIVKGVLTFEDLDARCFEALKAYDAVDGPKLLKLFERCSLAYVENKSSYLCGVMKLYRQCKASGMECAPIGGPKTENVKALLDRTGYRLEVSMGQRKYGGPPPNWGEKKQPGAGHMIFIGKLPRDCYEDELVPMLEECGDIWDLRVMMAPDLGQNRGYAFCCFTSKEAAKKACNTLDGREFRGGSSLRVNLSNSNMRLFMGNIPKTKGKEEILEELNPLMDGISEVIVYPVADDPKGALAKCLWRKNRGFCFIDFDTHLNASNAKRKLSNPKNARMWNTMVVVDWADPQEEPDEEVMSKVKNLYVRNISQDIDEEQLREKFKEFGEVERCVRTKDYGFVHFTTREAALAAIEGMNGEQLGQNKIEVQLAKPQSEGHQRRKMQRRDMHHGGMGRGGYGGGYGDPMAPWGGYGGGGGGYDWYGYGPWGPPPYGGPPRGGYGPPRGGMGGGYWPRGPPGGGYRGFRGGRGRGRGFGRGRGMKRKFEQDGADEGGKAAKTEAGAGGEATKTEPASASEVPPEGVAPDDSYGQSW